jgi:hypothetical protein
MHIFSRTTFALLLVAALHFIDPRPVVAATYEVGPGHAFETPSEVPWESLVAGDTVLIYWRSTPYKDKWIISRQGTAGAPITVSGVPGLGGALPIIDGAGAVTRLALDYWNEDRAVIKIGGSSLPTNVMPAHIVIENLDVRRGRSAYTFTDDAGVLKRYAMNAAAIFIEKGEHITIRNNQLHDSGNGLFVASADPNVSRSILVEGNAIYDNGNVGSAYEHNVYGEALGLTYQHNYFGPLKAGSVGTNLKDRSGALVVRFNWIDGGNRQLDLSDSASVTIRASALYRQTNVYGNVLIEHPGADNRQVVWYGGDSGTTSRYRKGTLYFYNNTVISYRTDRTTLFGMPTNEERVDARNNIFYVTAAGTTLSVLDIRGMVDLLHNWFKPGHVSAFGTFTGLVTDNGTIDGAVPGFVNLSTQDFRLAAASPARDTGTSLSPAFAVNHDMTHEYVKHQGAKARANDGTLDLGAFEAGASSITDLFIVTSALARGMLGNAYDVTLAGSGGLPPYAWSLASGTLPPGLTLNSITGRITGTPTQAGSWTVSMRLSDSQVPTDTATKALSITVDPAATRRNVAQAANGGRVSASSTYGSKNAANWTNDGKRPASLWTNTWADATANAYPDWVRVDFSSTKTIREVDVFSGQLDATTAPTTTLTSTYTLRDFQLQYWNGTQWKAITGGMVTGNQLVWRKFTFSPIATSAIRIVITRSGGVLARVAEIEAYE